MSLLNREVNIICSHVCVIMNSFVVFVSGTSRTVDNMRRVMYKNNTVSK